MAGGTGGGVMLTPIGFLVSNKTEVKYISTKDDASYQKILELIAKTCEKITKKMCQNNKNKETQNETK